MAERFTLLLLGVLLVAGCRGDGPAAGSETHFLRYCTSAGSCADGLSCVCGVCSDTCSDSDRCRALLPEAICREVDASSGQDRCEGASLASSCDVLCTADTDCQTLSSGHRCDRGLCRQIASDCERGETLPGDVVLMGDLFLAGTGNLPEALYALARSVGALPQDETYRDYSSDVTTAFGGENDLVSQYSQALAEGPFRTVILDAGGPDALLACDAPPTADCPSLEGAVNGTRNLLSQMAQDGTEHIILFFYPDPDDVTLAAKFDVLRPLLLQECQASVTPCWFIDLRPTFVGHEAEYLLEGGVLPTEAGATAAATAIWSAMERHCVAQ